MKNFDFPSQFKVLYDHAVTQYAQGKRGAESFFTVEQKAWLAANGITAQHMYDYAEDHNNYDGLPGFGHALTIETIRRDYFLNAQKGKASTATLAEASMPGKDETVRGVGWLPRLLPKAKAKLRGELPASIMYGCGGDRKFFKERDILPAEFLAVVWRHENDDAAIVDWVVRQGAAK